MLPILDGLNASQHAGHMPNLAEILGRGARGRVSSSPIGLSAMIWPKWFEGGRTGSWYFPKQWNPDRMCLEWITALVAIRNHSGAIWTDVDSGFASWTYRRLPTVH